MRALGMVLATAAEAQDLFLSPSTQASPTPKKQPCVMLKNAARPGTCMPLTGLGVEGYGCKTGAKTQCWHFGTMDKPGECCTKDYCPAVNATRDWLKLGGERLDTGYPYGDDVDNWPPSGHRRRRKDVDSFEGRRLGSKPWHDLVGISEGIKQSGLRREDIFVTGKAGTAGPMSTYETKQDVQIVQELGLQYIDLLLMHYSDAGTPGHGSGAPCKYFSDYDPDKCRALTWTTLVQHYQSGLAKAIGVANWDASDLQHLKDNGCALYKANCAPDGKTTIMPSVAQYRFHPHKSTSNQKIRELIDFCKANNITFNAYSPLGSPDFTTFEHSVGTPSLLMEPKIQAIATRVNKTAAQVILRWVAQQGFPTNPRTQNTEHMKENLDVFDWELSDSDMQMLSNMPQCAGDRGDRYDENCEAYGGHGNSTGPTRTC